MPGPAPHHTSRLLLRAPLPSDVDAIFEIQGNHDTMRFTYCAPDRAATETFLAKHAARLDEDGFAPWTALLGGRVAGWGGLCRDPDQPHWGVEVIYFVHPDLCGRGLAGEIVGASLQLAFDELALPRVDAYARPANLASTRVLARAGFRCTGYVAELERDHFCIDAAQWKSERAASEVA